MSVESMHAAISGEPGGGDHGDTRNEPLGTRLRRAALQHVKEHKHRLNEACVQKLVSLISARAKEFPDRTEFVLTVEEAKSCGDIPSVVDRLARERIFCVPEPQAGLPALLGAFTIFLGELPAEVANEAVGIALLRAARGEDPKTGADLRHLADGAGLSDRGFARARGPVLYPSLAEQVQAQSEARVHADGADLRPDGAGLSDRGLDQVQDEDDTRIHADVVTARELARQLREAEASLTFTDTDRLNWLELAAVRVHPHEYSYIAGLVDRVHANNCSLREAMDILMKDSRCMKVGA